jgi:hypothetical protein
MVTALGQAAKNLVEMYLGAARPGILSILPIGDQ